MSESLIILENMATSNRFAATNAESLVGCADYGTAAVEMIEEIYSNSIPISAEEKSALLEYLKEYGHRDKEVYDAFARLLD